MLVAEVLILAARLIELNGMKASDEITEEQSRQASLRDRQTRGYSHDYLDLDRCCSILRMPTTNSSAHSAQVGKTSGSREKCLGLQGCRENISISHSHQTGNATLSLRKAAAPVNKYHHNVCSENAPVIGATTILYQCARSRVVCLRPG